MFNLSVQSAIFVCSVARTLRYIDSGIHRSSCKYSEARTIFSIGDHEAKSGDVKESASF